ncbi:MAG: hypothetical protein JXM73_01850 [Anaerolineae bacterium]|nr:hypothetical protein [Anaerolineae bacterium]
MDPPTSIPDDTRPKKSRRRRANRFRAAVRLIWQDWWVEILVGISIALAVFLLAERMNIRETLRAWLLGLGHGLWGLVTSLARAVVNRVQHTTLSDLAAYVLLTAAFSLVMWRTRWRLMASPRFTNLKCPRCGGEVHRVHRRWRDRLLNLYVPVRRYQCEDPDCGWRGLRVKRYRHR